jgi:hypothetical protein
VVTIRKASATPLRTSSASIAATRYSARSSEVARVVVVVGATVVEVTEDGVVVGVVEVVMLLVGNVVAVEPLPPHAEIRSNNARLSAGSLEGTIGLDMCSSVSRPHHEFPSTPYISSNDDMYRGCPPTSDQHLIFEVIGCDARQSE